MITIEKYLRETVFIPSGNHATAQCASKSITISFEQATKTTRTQKAQSRSCRHAIVIQTLYQTDTTYLQVTYREHSQKGFYSSVPILNETAGTDDVSDGNDRSATAVAVL